ncbi:MAG: hypothetical protein JW697_06665 [Kosmotogaceae bacterium]|nr:hypothetical protein [Kosmotogaceae bacterium]
MKMRAGYSTIIAIFGILMGVIAILNYLFPLNHMPLPEGPHEVGFRSYEVSNPQPTSVAEINFSDPGKIRLDIWYPAGDVSEALRKGWIDNDPLVFQGFEIMTGYPRELFEHIYRVKTNSFVEAPPVEDSSIWPIMILLLGWSSISELHTSLAESLASAGYFVVSIEHPGACAVVSFSNGDVHYFLGNDLLEKLPEGTRESKVGMLSKYLARDIDYAIEYLQRMNCDPSSDFFERINMNNIGLYGHSGGGAVAIQYALVNSDVPMVLADPTLEGFSTRELDTAFSNEILLMTTEEWESGINGDYSSSIAKERNEHFYNLRISDMRHVDFAMVRNLSPLTFFFGETGRFMNDEDAIRNLDSAVKLFFDSVFFGGEIEELFALSESVPEFSM